MFLLEAIEVNLTGRLNMEATIIERREKYGSAAYNIYVPVKNSFMMFTVDK